MDILGIGFWELIIVMIIAMMITPLTLLLLGWRFPRWLLLRRRYLGVAAFGYAADDRRP